MIEILNGVKETVRYDDDFAMRIYLNEEAENYPIHWHTDVEIIMPLENIYTVLAAGQSYVLQPNEFIIIPSGVMHELIAPEHGKRVIIQFDCSLLYQLNGFDAKHQFLRSLFIIAVQNNSYYSELKQLLERIVNEYFSESSLKEASAYAYLIQFFVALGRNAKTLQSQSIHTQASGTKPHKYFDKFILVCRYMNEHCTEEISLDLLASIAGFSKFHFARMFKEIMGTTYYNYLNQYRIMHAEKLLLDPNLTVIEVAMRSGFGSLPTFNRVFKTIKKCTPSQYKSLYIQNNLAPDHSIKG